MSIYTTQLRFIVEQIQHNTESEPDDFSACYHYLGLDSYPIFDEQYRAFLNDKIIRHFYFREIGFETAAQFAWYLRNTMNEVMPYFNQLYESMSVISDPISNKKYSWSETYELAQGGRTDSTVAEQTTSTLNRSDDTTDTLDYGKTDTTTTDYGRTTDETSTTNYGKTSEDTTTTTYGRTQDTQNGGSDETVEGGTHERVIHSDTPMNLIPQDAVEDLHYATDVRYTDREGTTASVTEYGGTTSIENGGSDTTVSDSELGGSDSTVKSGELGGEDVVTNVTDGDDVRTIDYDRTDTGSGSKSGTSAMVRDLDESGSREHTILGYDGVAPADLLMKWRQTFLNIDMQVIASLEKLFFGLWM